MALDIKALLDDAHAQESLQSHGPESLDGIEGAGLLYRRTLDSPEFKFAFPFKLLAEGTTGVVLVGDYVVELHRLVRGERLELLSRRTDFDAESRIVNAAMYARPPTSPELEGSAADYDVLLLVLESSDLRWCQVSRTDSGSATLDPTILEVPLPYVHKTDMSGTELLAEGLAVEERGLLAAVTSTGGYLWLENLSNTKKSASGPSDPANLPASILLTTNLIALKPYFLPTTSSVVHLLLVGVDPGKMRYVCRLMSWASHLRLDHNNVHLGEIQPLPYRGTGKPLMIIPLETETFPGSFLVATNDGLCLFSHIYTGHMSEVDQFFLTNSTDLNQSPSESIKSKSTAYFVNWSRPADRNLSESVIDELYAIRDDGVIFHIVIGSRGSAPYISDITQTPAPSTGSVLTCLHPPRQTGTGSRLLLTTGDCRPTKVLSLPRSLKGKKLAVHDEASCLSRTLKHSHGPLTDVCIVSKQQEEADGPSIALAACGLHSGGGIVNIVRGIPCSVTSTVEARELEGADEIWTFTSANLASRLKVLSMPLFSRLFLDQASLSFDLDEPTLAAACVDHESVDQCILHRIVSEGLITTLLGRSGVLRVSALHIAQMTNLPEASRVTAAVADHAQRMFYIAITSLQGGTHLARVGMQEVPSHGGQACTLIYSFPKDVLITFLGLARLTADGQQLLVTTSTGSLGILHVLPEDVVHPMLDYQFAVQPSPAQAHDVCENAILLKAPYTVNGPKGSFSDGDDKWILGAGMRHGVLKCLLLSINATHTITIQDQIDIKLGVTSVRLKTIPCGKDNTEVYALCGSQPFTIDLAKVFERHLKVIKIILNDASNDLPAHLPIACFAVDRRSSVPGGREATFFTCVTDKTIMSGVMSRLFTQLMGASYLRYPVEGTPNRIIHSSSTNSLIISRVHTQVHKTGKSQALVPIVDLVPISTSEDSQLEGDSIQLSRYVKATRQANCIWVGVPGERVTAICEWTHVKIDQTAKESTNSKIERRHFIVLAKMRTSAEGSEAGSLQFIRLGKVDKTGVYVSEGSKKETNESMPVLTMCSYGNDSLLYCAGAKLLKRTYDNAGRWVRVGMRDLPSRGLHISTSGKNVYVSTASHSICAFHFQDDGSLAELFNHNMCRASLHHLALPAEQLLLATDKLGSVIGLPIRPPGHPSPYRSTGAIFRARLPCSIARLYRADHTTFALHPPDRNPGILARNIHGLAADGSAYSFAVLSYPTWRLLRFTQDLILRNIIRAEVTVPGREPQVLDRQRELQDNDPDTRTIDAEILKDLLYWPDAVGLLRLVFAEGPVGHKDSTPVDLPRGDPVFETFLTLATNAMDLETANSVPKDGALTKKTPKPDAPLESLNNPTDGNRGANEIDADKCVRDAVVYMRSIVALVE